MAPTAGRTTSGDKITIAVLGNKLDNLTELVKGYCKEQDAISERVRNLELDHTRLETRFSVWSGINSVVAMVAAVISTALGIRQQP